MACHAGALCVAHAAQAVWVLTENSCRPLAYIINFFLVAAASWLQIICFNMAQGFRQMLRSNVGPQSSKKEKKFFYFSLYGWGVPFIFTAVILGTETDYIFSGPLYHTRTCFFEEGPISRTKKMNSFFFYYFWMCVMLFLNMAFFIYTTIKIRAIRKDTAILHRKEDGRQPSSTRRSAVLYVKLLLVMGVLETAVDVGAWALKNSNVPSVDGVRITDKIIAYTIFLTREYSYRWVAHSVDLLRACAVFAVCCCGEAARKRARELASRCVRRRRPPAKPRAAEMAARAAAEVSNGPRKALHSQIRLWTCCTRSVEEMPGGGPEGTFCDYVSRSSVDTSATGISLDSRSSSLT